jgi:hypothetical protein
MAIDSVAWWVARWTSGWRGWIWRHFIQIAGFLSDFFRAMKIELRTSVRLTRKEPRVSLRAWLHMNVQ